MDLIFELMPVVVIEATFTVEGVRRSAVVLDQEVAVLSRVDVLEEPPLNIGVGAPNVSGKPLGVGQEVHTRPPTPGVPVDRDCPEGPPAGHCET